MRYIIMAGGKYTEWEEPKHLQLICGEPIIARTLRLLRENGIEDIAISTHDRRFERFGVPLLEHENNITIANEILDGCWVTAFYPTEEPACYIMGDVVFSPTAIETIVNTETDSISFFASAPPLSPLFIKKWAEPFAFKVVDQARFRAAIDYVIANKDTGIFHRPPISWELWQVILGRDVREINYETVTAINDYSCDVDHPEDLKKLEEIICRS